MERNLESKPGNLRDLPEHASILGYPVVASLNLNDFVVIRVNPTGEEILRTKHSVPKRPEGSSYAVMQLHQVIRVFGPSLGLGGQEPIDMTIGLVNPDYDSRIGTTWTEYDARNA